MLDSIALTLDGPELSAEGLFWLATGAPTAEDALPTLDNWLGAIISLPLRSPDPLDLYPSPFLLRFDALMFTEAPARSKSGPFSTATLGAWGYSYVVNSQPISVPVLDVSGRPVLDASGNPTFITRTIYEQLLAHGIFDATAFWAAPPLVWRRHGRAPTSGRYRTRSSPCAGAFVIIRVMNVEIPLASAPGHRLAGRSTSNCWRTGSLTRPRSGPLRRSSGGGMAARRRSRHSR